MEKYEKPVIEVVEMENENVILTSDRYTADTCTNYAVMDDSVSFF